MLRFLVTQCLVVPVQPCMEWMPIKKKKYVLVEKTPGTLISLLLYPWKFRTKQSLTHGNSTKFCYKNVLHPWNFKTKNQNPCFTQIFLDLGISSCFLINAWKFHMPFLNTPEKACPQVPCFFSETAQWMVPIASSYKSKHYRLLGTLTYSLINSTSWLPDS